MKILTNLSDNKYNSISKGFTELSHFVRKRNNVKLVGVNILQSENDNNEIRESKNIKLHLLSLPYKKITNPLSGDTTSLDDFRNKYEIVTDRFREVVKKEKPDAILLNGTYEIPWSLMNATKDLKIPTFVQYIGLLTKERPNQDRHIFTQMEKEFDNSHLKYIFPSNLAKKTVEKEIFGHKVGPSIILPNPIPAIYFTPKPKKRRNKIGFVGRWAEVKNFDFCIDLSNYLLKIGSNYKLFFVLDKVSDKTKIPKNVLILGPFGNKQMKDFYQDMGVILSPSHFETYGRVPQEAVATGTPALINKNMGVAEVFEKYGLSDLIIEFSSPKKVLQKIDLFSNKVTDIRIRNQMKKDLSSSIIYQQLLNFVCSNL